MSGPRRRWPCLALLGLLGGCVQVVVPDPGPGGEGSAAVAGALLGALLGTALDGGDRAAHPPPTYEDPEGVAGPPKRR